MGDYIDEMGLNVACGPYRSIEQEPWNEVLDKMQELIGFHVDRLWPGEGIEIAALSLCEEAGEVARAVAKRAHKTRGSQEKWTANLRTEIGQVVGVCMDIARREGFSVADVMAETLGALAMREKGT